MTKNHALAATTATRSAAMAAKSHLPAATLCFLLVVLAAQGKDNDTVAILVIDGKAQCKSNPSRIISSKKKNMALTIEVLSS